MLTYSVVYYPLEFEDVANHWAKDAINDIGSRMVVSGVGNSNYEPDRDITRAEFAAVVAKALGLKPGEGSKEFNDVETSDWYNGYVKTACEYKIITGRNANTFAPKDKITREEAMTIIARAINITPLAENRATDETDKLLTGFKDASDMADYAKNSIATCIKTGIVLGRNVEHIAPKDNITRAETAQIINKLLQKAGLI
jgi:hypothetical protein